jgi:hypothetical protein
VDAIHRGDESWVLAGFAKKTVATALAALVIPQQVMGNSRQALPHIG